jgi:hypothetical protein
MLATIFQVTQTYPMLINVREYDGEALTNGHGTDVLVAWTAISKTPGSECCSVVSCDESTRGGYCHSEINSGTNDVVLLNFEVTYPTKKCTHLTKDVK